MVICPSVASRPVFSSRAVTALFLERQHLARPRAARLTPRRLCRFVEDVGGLQMDSINVLDRAHYLTVWSRFGPYDRRHLDRLVYRRRLLFEYWPHAACLVPTAALPWARRAATELDLAWSLTFPRRQGTARRAALRSMLERGEITEIEVAGSSARWLALTRDLPALATAGRRHAPSRGTTLLAPFDSLLWYRNRVTRLFGFDYRIEVYTPGPKRVHGYYTLPILHDGRLIGRVDAKAHRVERKLEIRHVHLEPWFAQGLTPPCGWGRVDRDEGLAGLGEALRSLAVFVGAHAVKLVRVTPRRLRGPMARAIPG